MCGQDLSANRLPLCGKQVETWPWFWDPEMPACGEPKYGAAPVLTALTFPKVYSVFFRKKSYVMSCYVSDRSQLPRKVNIISVFQRDTFSLREVK